MPFFYSLLFFLFFIIFFCVYDGFRCKRCDGRIREIDLAEDLMVDGETYECVKSFCYLGDTLDGDGGADLAATARISEMDG